MAQSLKCFTDFDPRVFMDELKEGDMDWALSHVASNATWRIPVTQNMVALRMRASTALGSLLN